MDHAEQFCGRANPSRRHRYQQGSQLRTIQIPHFAFSRCLFVALGGFTFCPEKLPCFTGPAAFHSVAFKIIGKQVREDNTP
jgi:hypothetical protein